jgi:co-chaperonin GroES (HSP10)
MNPSSLRPLNGFVLLRKAEATEKSSGGLYLPPSVDRNNTGESAGVVVALSEQPELYEKKGREEYLHPQDVLSIGDRVTHRGFLRHVNAIGHLFGCQNHDEYYLVKISEILGVVEGDSVTLGKYGEYRA